MPPHAGPDPLAQARDLLSSARDRLRAGDHEGAIRDLEQAHGRAAAVTSPPLEIEILTELGAALGAHGRDDAALNCLETAARAAREAGLGALEAAALVAEARLTLSRGATARARRALLEAVRLFDESYAAARACGDAESALALADRSREARSLLAPLDVAAGPESRVLAERASRDETARTQRESALAERLQAAARSLVAERDPERVLARVLEAAIEATGAERGFLLVASDKPAPRERELPFKLEVVAARNFDRRAIDRPELKVSRTVLERALTTHAPVLVREASRDAALAGRTSVEEQSLRSIACVPIESRRDRGLTAALYLDNRFGAGSFDASLVAALSGFAAHAAVAFENARLHRQAAAQNLALEEARTRAEELARKLEAELARTGAELGLARAKLDETRTRLAGRGALGDLAGSSRAMQLVYDLVEKLKDSDAPVLISGESGTGKELVARALHFQGRRRDQPFVGENCAAIPEALVESTLFGHEAGAFTGANARRAGLFELAGEGTLFLDEIGDLSSASQAKLLRVLQERRVRRVGGSAEIVVQPRIVAATHRDLAALVTEGRFREDLFYRLNVVRVSLPPLRERREDIPVLIQRLCAADGVAVPRFAPEAYRALLDHSWPGNVRELSNELRRLTALVTERVAIEDLSPALRATVAGARTTTTDPAVIPTWKEAERRMLISALRAAGGQRAQAAQMLALPYGTLWNKMRKHKIEDSDIFGPAGT